MRMLIKLRSGSILTTSALAVSASLLTFAAPANAATDAAATPAVPVAAASSMPPIPQVTLHRGPAQVEPAAVTPQRGAQQIRQAPLVANMTYHGGPVTHQPRVYLVFWGTQWQSNPNGAASYMYYYFQGLGQPADNWSPIMSQYTDATGQGPTFGVSALAGAVIDNSPVPFAATAAQIAAEAVAGANYFGSFGTDSQVFVLSPSGAHPAGFPTSGFCAYHSATTDALGRFVAFTNMPYVLDAGTACAANSVRSPLDGFSIIGGHEYAETITDVALNAWYDTNLAGEIGDKCQTAPFFAQTLPTGVFAQQMLWSNAANGCVQF